MIRIDALWLAVDPVDMRAGPERLLARVVRVFGSARAHHGYRRTSTAESTSCSRIAGSRRTDRRQSPRIWVHAFEGSE
jgi:hypothetical protein